MMTTVTNLYPRPDQPTRAMFNYQLFQALAATLGTRAAGCGLRNLVLVPEWRVWRWPAIRRWQEPGKGADCRPKTTDRRPQTEDSLSAAPCPLPTVYLPVFYLPVIGRSINGWFYYRALRRHLGSRTPPPASDAAILASWLYPDAVAVARVAEELGAPVWLRVHGTDRYHLKHRWRRTLILRAVGYSRGVICNCRAVADDLSKHGIPSSKIRIVPNGVDTALFRVRSKEAIMDLSPQAIAPSLKTEDGERKLPDSGIRPPGFGSPSEVRGLKSVVLYVGNLVPVKGPDIMLRAFAALQERRRDAGSETWNAKGERPVGAEALPPPASGPQSDVSLLIIGTGPMRAKLERMARDLGVADKVRFLGSRPHAEVARWMNRADVLCLTSRSEGMPNVVVEALASGLPVVATDVGACPELLADEPEARVCRREDVGGIAVALADCLGRDIDREAVADRCSSRYSWRKAAERLLDVLQVGEPAGDGRPS